MELIKRISEIFNPLDPRNRYTCLRVFARNPRNRYTGLTDYVCMYACMYVYMCVCTHVCIYVCMDGCMCVCVICVWI